MQGVIQATDTFTTTRQLPMWFGTQNKLCFNEVMTSVAWCHRSNYSHLQPTQTEKVNLSFNFSSLTVQLTQYHNTLCVYSVDSEWRIQVRFHQLHKGHSVPSLMDIREGKLIGNLTEAEALWGYWQLKHEGRQRADRGLGTYPRKLGGWQ